VIESPLQAEQGEYPGVVWNSPISVMTGRSVGPPDPGAVAGVASQFRMIFVATFGAPERSRPNPPVTAASTRQTDTTEIVGPQSFERTAADRSGVESLVGVNAR
jgi:hypothetical protein